MALQLVSDSDILRMRSQDTSFDNWLNTFSHDKLLSKM